MAGFGDLSSLMLLFLWVFGLCSMRIALCIWACFFFSGWTIFAGRFFVAAAGVFFVSGDCFADGCSVMGYIGHG